MDAVVQQFQQALPCLRHPFIALFGRRFAEAASAHTCRSLIPWRVLLGLRIKPVINRQICSNPSIRRKTFLKLSIPLARISGTRIIGSMASPFFFYLLTPLIFLHSLIFPNNLPSRER